MVLQSLVYYKLLREIQINHMAEYRRKREWELHLHLKLKPEAYQVLYEWLLKKFLQNF